MVVDLEEVVCIVKDAYPAGILNVEKDPWALNQYDLFFTNRRVVAAVVRSSTGAYASVYDRAPSISIIQEALKYAPEDLRKKFEDVKECKPELLKEYVPEILKYVADGVKKWFDNVNELVQMVGMLYSWFKGEEVRNLFKGKTVEEILQLHPHNFEIPYESIRSMKLKRWTVYGTIIEIKALFKGEERKLKFSIPKSQFNYLREVINKYLPIR